MATTVDNRLLQAAQRGDGDALERLVEVCLPDVRRYVRHHCAVADTDDAIQESIIILFRRASTLRNVGTLSSWLFQVVRRECQRLSRKMFRQDVQIDEAIERQYLSSHDDVELRLDIAMAIQSLPDIYREVTVLRDFEELTVQEIGQRLGLVPETVKTRLRRARQLIREHLLA